MNDGRIILVRTRENPEAWEWLMKQVGVENVPVIELIRNSELHRQFEERVRV